jgi:SPP1 family predicted phage head-tail adaptor
MDAGAFDKKITLMHRIAGTDPAYNTPTGEWVPFAANIWASVKDFLPSRGERLAEGISIANRPARIRIRYREGVTGAMRVLYRGRTLQIIAGPAEIGDRRDGMEFVAEEISPMGDPT